MNESNEVYSSPSSDLNRNVTQDKPKYPSKSKQV